VVPKMVVVVHKTCINMIVGVGVQTQPFCVPLLPALSLVQETCSRTIFTKPVLAAS
jgi:hypothetical protein